MKDIIELLNDLWKESDPGSKREQDLRYAAEYLESLNSKLAKIIKIVDSI